LLVIKAVIPLGQKEAGLGGWTPAETIYALIMGLELLDVELARLVHAYYYYFSTRCACSQGEAVLPGGELEGVD